MQNEKPTTVIAEKPAIKIRRLSGDTLSLNNKPAEPPTMLATVLNQPPASMTINPSINHAPQTTSSIPGSTIKITGVFSLGDQTRNNPVTTTPSLNSTLNLPKSITITTQHRNVLKPWSKLLCTKSQEICTTMLQNLCLYSLFKCMARDCQFSNSSAETMVQHLRYHAMRMQVPVSGSATWLECAYCDDPFDRLDQLVSHVVTEHSTSIFQCPYCFYRACAAHNVLLHIKTMHLTKEPLVFVCRGKAKMLTSDLPSILAARDKNVLRIKCSKGNSIEQI